MALKRSENEPKMEPTSIKRWREGEETRGRGEERREGERKGEKGRRKGMQGEKRHIREIRGVKGGCLAPTAANRGRFILP